MRLVVDASTLVAEVLRARGRKLLAHSSLDLAVAADAWSETEHELSKRVALLVERGYLEPASAIQLLDEALATIAARVTLVASEIYADRLAEARQRVPRDPRDAPTIALALTLDCGIWTGDHDFFGCGLPVWITETLLRHVEAPKGE
ncbi:MAG: nucleotide-binding protein, PIN domain-containing protein [Chloroflexi bacterium]|nr:nucleotide-binding protein, PIN domain-containing protein [Chloroflexota bacterium]